MEREVQARETTAGSSHYSRIYLARHGETESNRSRRYAGRSDEGLTSRGTRQILELARTLAREDIESVRTSPIVRAAESAEIISRELGIPLQVEPRLAEMLMDSWEGLTEAEVERAYPREYLLWNTTPDRLDMQGRETLSVLASRVMAAVDDASRRARPVLLMTHVAPMRVAVLSVLDLDLSYYKRLSVPNATCLMVDRERGDVRRIPGLASVHPELEKAVDAMSAEP